MKVYGKIIYFNYSERYFVINHKNRQRYYYLSKRILNDYKNYLTLNPYIVVDVLTPPLRLKGFIAYEVNHFIKITVPKRYQDKTYFNLNSIQKEIKTLINRPYYKLFLDLEFSLPGNNGKPTSEIVQYGMILEDPQGQVILEETSLLKPYQDKALNARTLLFLSKVLSDFDNAASYIEFYQLLERCIRDYNVKIIAWGNNDILAMQKSFKFNHLIPLDLRGRYLNLMQIIKNYYSARQEKGLFATYQEYTKTPLMLQSHDAMEDARIAREIFHLFKNEINN